MPDVREAAAAVFREESGLILSSLIRISRSFDRAEEAIQEAFAAALVSWSDKGIPESPGAWVMAVAHRKLIDLLRREQTRCRKQDALAYETETIGRIGIEDGYFAMPFQDDRLKLIFTCCHPALNAEAQVALTLRTLGGLSTPEIAKAFLVPEPTLAQRLVRAKRKIQAARIPYEVPPKERLPERLASVQSVIYLIFNEGYTTRSGTQLMRQDLCAEAIRLGRVLCELLPDRAESMGLLALMLLHHSRRDARMRQGELVTLEEQDRSLWDRSAIEEGLQLIDKALRIGPVGPYQLQAAIAGVHSQAARPEVTDWRQIEGLYGALLRLHKSPVIALNHAVALSMSAGYEVGLQRIDKLGEGVALGEYYLFHAARADLLRRLLRTEEAREAYERAIELATNDVEQRFLRRKLESLSVTSTAK